MHLKVLISSIHRHRIRRRQKVSHSSLSNIKQAANKGMPVSCLACTQNLRKCRRFALRSNLFSHLRRGFVFLASLLAIASVHIYSSPSFWHHPRHPEDAKIFGETFARTHALPNIKSWPRCLKYKGGCRVAIRYNTVQVPGLLHERAQRVAEDFASCKLLRHFSYTEDFIHCPSDFDCDIAKNV